MNCTQCYKIIAVTNLLGRERLHVGVGPVGDGGVGVRHRLERLGVALEDAGRQLDLGRLRLHLVGAVDVVVASVQHQLLLPLSDLPADELILTGHTHKVTHFKYSHLLSSHFKAQKCLFFSRFAYLSRHNLAKG